MANEENRAGDPEASSADIVSEGAELHMEDAGVTRSDPNLRREADRGPSDQRPKVSGVGGGTVDLSHEPVDKVTAAADKTGAGPNGGAAH